MSERKNRARRAGERAAKIKRNPAEKISGVIPHQTVIHSDSDELDKARAEAPELEIPREGITLNVKRVSMDAGRIDAFIETSDGEMYRLPRFLFAWANDTITLLLSVGGNDVAHVFPANVHFARDSVDIL